MTARSRFFGRRTVLSAGLPLLALGAVLAARPALSPAAAADGCSRYILGRFQVQRAEVLGTLTTTLSADLPEPMRFALASRADEAAPGAGTQARSAHPDACDIAVQAIMPWWQDRYEELEEQLLTLADDDGAYGVSFGIAVTRNQLGRFQEVTGDSRIRISTDPLLQYEYARALFLTGQADAGLEALETALAAGDSAVHLLLLEHLYLVLTPDTRARVYSNDLRGTVQLAMREMRSNAALAGISLPRRLAIHYQRLQHADTWYFGRSSSLEDADTSLAALAQIAPTAHDARRDVYVRLGAPTREVHTMIIGRTAGGSGEAVTWIYGDPEASDPVLYHFTGAQSPYHLSSGGNCAWHEDRASLDPLIGAVYLACRGRDGRLLAERRAAFARVTRQAYERNANRVLVSPARIRDPFSYALYSFRSSRSPFIDVVAIAGARLSDARGQPREVSVFLTDESEDVHSAMLRDSARSAANAQSFATYSLPVAGIRAGHYRYRIRMSDTLFTEGMVYGGDFDVPELWDERLALSDLIVARDTAGGVLKRNGVSLSPYLGAITKPRFAAYWEVYGVVPGSTLNVTLQVLGEGGLLRRRERLNLTFAEVVETEGPYQVRRSIEHNLPPGRYTLTVRVRRAGSDETAERSSVLMIQ